MQVVLITPPTTAPSEVHLVNRMFEAGLPVLHLRKPTADAAALRQYLQDVKPQYLSRVVVHQHHPLAQEFPLKVSLSVTHVTKRDLPLPPQNSLSPVGDADKLGPGGWLQTLTSHNNQRAGSVAMMMR